MALLDIAGGASKGYVQGQEDEQRRQEFLSLQRQRKRVEDQQKQDDALTETLKKVRPAGKYEDVDRTGAPDPTKPWEAAPDFMGPGSGGTKKTTIVSPADAARARAAAYMQSGRAQDVQAGGQQEQLAYAADQQAEQQKQRQLWDGLRQAKAMNLAGNSASALRLLQQGYTQVPDGHQIVTEERNGVLHSGVAGPDGRYIAPPQPVTQQSVDAMIEQGYSMLSPETYGKSQELGIQRTTAGAHVMSAEAAKTNAKTAADKAYWETIGAGGSAEVAKKAAEEEYLRAHAAYFRNKTAAEGAGGAETYGAPIAMQDASGNMVYGIPTKKGVGPPGITPISMPQGWTFPKPPPVMNDVQKGAHTALMKMDQDGAFDGPGGAAKRDKFIMTNGLDKFVKVDPIMQALRDAGPKGDSKAAPAKAVDAPSPTKAATPEAAAEAKVSEAEKALSKFGSRQKRDDPAGYAAAVRQRTAAQAELDALNAKYAATQPTGAAFTAARP
jgi:hypothetical protein